jgi:hypothetical protein
MPSTSPFYLRLKRGKKIYLLKKSQYFGTQQTGLTFLNTDYLFFSFLLSTWSTLLFSVIHWKVFFFANCSHNPSLSHTDIELTTPFNPRHNKRTPTLTRHHWLNQRSLMKPWLHFSSTICTHYRLENKQETKTKTWKKWKKWNGIEIGIP